MCQDTVIIAPDVHAVAVNGDLVFLDVVRDTYVCLPEADPSAQLSEDRRSLALADPELARDLREAGLVVSPSGAVLARPDLAAARLWTPPTRSALSDTYPLPRIGDGLEIARSVADLLVAYRGRPFRDIVGAVRRPRTRPPEPAPELISTVEAFHRWAPFAPTSAKCLLRSFMLLRRLQRRGLDALWVFGVRTWPFHAHCWLQCGDLVLDDEPDRIRAFTPIMVV